MLLLIFRKMVLDKQTRMELAQVFNQAAREAYLLYNEEWISAKELCKQFQMFTPSWLKSNGHFLPREQAGVCKNGKTSCTRFAYPKHEIAKMIRNGMLNFGETCEYRPAK